MKRPEVLWEICMDIYREMYSKSKPKADFDKLIKRGVTKKENWFMKYYMPQEEQLDIIKRHCAKHKLDKHDIKKVEGEILLGCSPNSFKEEK